MKIMVFDIPAESGGALTILKDYYQKALIDKDNIWYFVVSIPELKETSNIKILKYKYVKKSWIHRLYFDYIHAQKIVKKYNPDKIISLQNVIIPRIKKTQELYLHQPLPFCEKKYKMKEEFIFWLYQNLISKLIFKSIKKADKVIVQTEWMKLACLKKIKTDAEKFEVIPPELNIKVTKSYKKEKGKTILFFYPASAILYKNHKVIIEAVNKLKIKRIENYRVIFTLNGNENEHIQKIYKEVINKNLNIDFIGYLNQEEVYEYYGKSILIFPSYIETFGLPLIEAKMHKCPIIASDCTFSHEILDEYNQVSFFNPFDSEELVMHMSKLLKDI